MVVVVGRKHAGPLIVILLIVLLAAIVLFSSLSYKDLALPREIFASDAVELVGVGKSSISHHLLGSAYISQSESPFAFRDPAGTFSIKRSVLSASDHKFAFTINSQGFVKSLADARVSFNVLSTNGYGILVLKLNGKVIWSGVPESGSRIDSPLALEPGLLQEGENVITILTTSSGWRVWAPAKYVISDFSIMEDYTKKASTAIPLNLTNEDVETAMQDISGRLVATLYSTTPSMGKVRILVNNVSIWEGVPPSGSSYRIFADFSKTLTQLSESNLVVFSLEPSDGEDGNATGQGYFIDGIEVLVFRGENLTRHQVVDFELGGSEVQDLNEGRLRGEVSFSVSRVMKSGNISLILRNGNAEKVLFQTSPPGNDYNASVEFLGGDVVAGKNSLVFLSEDGMFEISKLRIALLPPEAKKA